METTPIAPVAELVAVVPKPLPDDVPKLFYSRGKRWPRAIAWLGFKSFWGHLWHLAASVIATEDIDCRDWMQPDPSRALRRRSVGVSEYGEYAVYCLLILLSQSCFRFLSDASEAKVKNEADAHLERSRSGLSSVASGSRPRRGRSPTAEAAARRRPSHVH